MTFQGVPGYCILYEALQMAGLFGQVFCGGNFKTHAVYGFFALLSGDSGRRFYQPVFLRRTSYYYMWKIIGYSRNYVEMFKNTASEMPRMSCGWGSKFDSAKDVTSGDKVHKAGLAGKNCRTARHPLEHPFFCRAEYWGGNVFQWKDVMFDYFAKA